MPYRENSPVLDIARERDDASAETSNDRFDRLAFARRALDLVRPARTRIALCEGARSVRVESGRQWGAGDCERWVMLFVPPKASRRAIALAVANLGEPLPYALDVLLLQADG